MKLSMTLFISSTLVIVIGLAVDVSGFPGTYNLTTDQPSDKLECTPYRIHDLRTVHKFNSFDTDVYEGLLFNGTEQFLYGRRITKFLFNCKPSDIPLEDELKKVIFAELICSSGNRMNLFYVKKHDGYFSLNYTLGDSFLYLTCDFRTKTAFLKNDTTNLNGKTLPVDFKFITEDKLSWRLKQQYEDYVRTSTGPRILILQSPRMKIGFYKPYPLWAWRNISFIFTTILLVVIVILVRQNRDVPKPKYFSRARSSKHGGSNSKYAMDRVHMKLPSDMKKIFDEYGKLITAGQSHLHTTAVNEKGEWELFFDGEHELYDILKECARHESIN